MARLKLEIPEKFLGMFSVPVRISDINYGNHLGNDAVVSIAHEARVQLLKKFNSTELEVFGTSLIMSELLVEFKAESFYGDVLQVKIYAGEISKFSFELFYVLSTQRDNLSIAVANAKTGLICFNYKKKKIEAVPEELKKILLGH